MNIVIVLLLFCVQRRQYRLKCFLSMMDLKFTMTIVSVTLLVSTDLEKKRSNYERKRKRPGKYYIKPRSTHWIQMHFPYLDDFEFRRMFRFPRDVFQQLIELYGEDLETHPPKGLILLPTCILNLQKPLPLLSTGWLQEVRTL
jgi:hypothetical protein